MTIKEKKKKLKFKIKNFLIFKNKIKYIILNNFPKGLSSWERENYNRNFIIKGLNEAKPEDYIMISDVDEIPKLTNLKILEKKKYTAFKQKMFYYRFNLHNLTEPDWIGTKVCKKKDLKSPQWLRNQKVKKYPFWRLDKINWNIIENGGWHFSFVMTDRGIKNKIESYAHSEFNKKNYKSIKNIKKNISLKKDLFGRPFKFIKINAQNKLPKYLLLNKKKFSKFLV